MAVKIALLHITAYMLWENFVEQLSSSHPPTLQTLSFTAVVVSLAISMT